MTLLASFFYEKWNENSSYAFETSRTISSESHPKNFLSKKLRNHKKNKEKTDFWSKTQKLKTKMSQEDIDNQLAPKDPLIKEIPTLRPESSPCDFRPNPSGITTQCNW